VGASTPTVSSISEQAFLQDCSATLEAAPTTRDDMCFWQYSSGSTGRPKGIVHLQHDMLYTAESYGKHVLKISENDICFSVPIDHLSVDERDARPGTGIPDDGRNRRRILQRKRPPLSRRLQQFERGAAVQVRIAHLSVSTLNRERERRTYQPNRAFADLFSAFTGGRPESIGAQLTGTMASQSQESPLLVSTASELIFQAGTPTRRSKAFGNRREASSS
jgi:AMP-binding enzyme